jgi:TetR/AcrR family transcriptional regulator
MGTYPKHLPADERKAATVETLVALAGEQNPAEITTTEIARRMGVTQGALFKHFPTKDAMLQAVLDWVAERLLSRMDKAVEKTSSPMAALEAMFMAHIEFVAAHPGVPRMLFGELQSAKETAPKRIVRTLIHRYGERLQRVIEEGKAKGELDRGLDTEAAVILFIGTIQGLVMQSLLTGHVRQIRRDAPRAFAIYRRGIGSAQ